MQPIETIYVTLTDNLKRFVASQGLVPDQAQHARRGMPHFKVSGKCSAHPTHGRVGGPLVHVI